MVLGLPLGVLWRMRLHGAQKFLQSRLNSCNVQLAPLYILKLQRKQTSQFSCKAAIFVSYVTSSFPWQNIPSGAWLVSRHDTKKSHSPDPTKHIPFSVLHLWKLSREKNANPCKIQVSAVCFGQVLFPRAKFLFRYIICYIVFRVLWGVRFRGTKKATVQTQPKNVQMAHIYFSEVVEETWDMQI